MSAHITGLFWGQLLGLLAIETAALVGLADLVQHWTQSARWKRTIWQVTVASLGAIVLLEVTGLGRGLVVGMTAPDSSPAIARLPLTRQPLPVETFYFPSGTQRGVTATETEPPTSVAADHSPAGPAISPASPPSAWWPGLIWLTGAGLVLARLGFARCLWMMICRRRQVIDDEELHARIRKIARQLGLHRRVRLLECERLNSPISFGLLQSTVVLTAGFAQAFSPAKQEAMLAHELAHLAASDPWWHLWTDVVSAILWWHPLIWWARRQLHITSETAADEASCVIANGPATLAECLVELGARLFAPRSFGGMGIEGRGFQSELGRRVERLIQMKESTWRPNIFQRSGMVKATGPLALVVVIVLCTAWVPPRAKNQGDTMKNLQQNWKYSLAGLALATVMSADDPAGPVRPPAIAVAAKAVPVATTVSAATTAISVQSPTPPASLSQVKPKETTTMSAGQMNSSRKTALEAKLEGTILKEISFDGLPLSEVLKYLAEEALRQDPDKTGVNFIISAAPTLHVQPASVHPAIRQPIPVEPVDLASVNIRLHMPIKNVRLKDTLEVLVKVADQPIKYTVEDYGVVFSLDAPGAKASSISSESSSFQPPLTRVISIGKVSDRLQIQTFNADTLSLLQGARIEALGNYNQMKAMLTSLLSLNRSELRDVLPTVWPDVLLTQLQTSLAQTEQELTSLRQDFGEDHPKVARAKILLEKIDSQIERRVQATLTGLQKKADVLKYDLEIRTEQVAAAEKEMVEAKSSGKQQ